MLSAKLHDRDNLRNLVVNLLSSVLFQPLLVIL